MIAAIMDVQPALLPYLWVVERVVDGCTPFPRLGFGLSRTLNLGRWERRACV